MDSETSEMSSTAVLDVEPLAAEQHSLRRPSRERVGLVAGGGTFPFELARSARKQGLEVVCVGIRHEVSPELASEVALFRSFSIGRLGAMLRYFKRHGVRRVSWAGWIRKERLFTPGRIWSLLPDWRTLKLWFFRLRDRQSQTMLAAIAEEFENEGLHVAHSLELCPDLLLEEGVLTRRQPTRRQVEDIRFGWALAKRMAELDVGQSVAVYEKSTLAVEGIEGTDRNIRRAGELCARGGFTVVKVAKEGHDMRFDVPTIGPDTVKTLSEAGGAVLAVEAGKTMVLDRDETLRLADELGIVVAAFSQAPEASG